MAYKRKTRDILELWFKRGSGDWVKFANSDTLADVTGEAYKKRLERNIEENHAALREIAMDWCLHWDRYRITKFRTKRDVNRR